MDECVLYSKKKHIKTRKRETTEIVMVRCWILNLFHSWVGEILIFSKMLRVLNTTSSIVHKVSIFHLKIGLKVNVIIIVWITYLRHIDKDWCNIVPSPCSYCSVCNIGWLQPVSNRITTSENVFMISHLIIMQFKRNFE